MLYWALLFLVVALIAGVLGFTGVAAAAAGIARIIFFIFIVLFLIALISQAFGAPMLLLQRSRCQRRQAPQPPAPAKAFVA